ncbi:MAG TPA: 3-methyl-2-oxobutanoate hydroxymethyltransferase [Vicinamibacterales bacterium]|nr:3-methyl-2-oxobutanoate hydroxymethyltransferase [Vicinamibacterales bacterium]
MSATPSAGRGKLTVPDVLATKRQRSTGEGPRLACLTAYDYPTAVLLDEAGIDVLLVGDSVGMTVLGYDTTLPVTLEDILHHTRAVRRGARRALVVADMPYGTCQVSAEEAIRAALRLVKEGGAEAVKVEGGERRGDLIRQLVDADIPVMGHVGLTPQSVNTLGGFQVQGRTIEAADQLRRDARAVEAAGAFAVVLESVPREVAARITADLRIPTIGIGAGPDCDGQILVFHDLVGLTGPGRPRFAREYAQLAAEVSQAARRYCADVQGGQFPSDAESFHLPAGLRDRFPVPSHS